MSYYKKSNLERQSFSGVKMDRGSLIYKILHLQIANELLISVPCYKTAKTWNIMYSHNIIKKIWESGEISACEAETRCETPVISGPSGSTALKKKKKAQSCKEGKEKAKCEAAMTIQKGQASLGQSSLKIEWGKVANCSVVRELIFLILYGKYGVKRRGTIWLVNSTQ